MESKLSGVPETMLIPLWSRAAETGAAQPIIVDHQAEDMVARISYDFRKFTKSKLTQIGVAIRTMLLDRATRDFMNRNPESVVVNLGAGLDTRFSRLDNGKIDWYDLDLPNAIELRRNFFEESDRYHLVGKSLFDFSWMDGIKVDGRPVLLIAEGLLMYFDQAEVKSLFLELCQRFPGAEMLFEMLAPAAVGHSKYHETVKKIDSKVEFKWGLKHSRAMESWHEKIRFVTEWDYYDYHRERWRFMCLLGRILRPRLSNRIVHIAFEE
jgi:O-methyltransferase involved in polyketide biosynthesis